MKKIDSSAESFNTFNEELPIGFTMELAMHSGTLNKFAQLPKSEQQTIVDGARNVKSREEMRSYVESIFK